MRYRKMPTTRTATLSRRAWKPATESGESGDGLSVAACLGQEIREEAMRLHARASGFCEHYWEIFPNDDDMARLAKVIADNHLRQRSGRPVALRAARPCLACTPSDRISHAIFDGYGH